MEMRIAEPAFFRPLPVINKLVARLGLDPMRESATWLARARAMRTPTVAAWCELRDDFRAFRIGRHCK